MNAVGRRLSESRVRENLMHGLRWQEMETETTAPLLDPTQIRPRVCLKNYSGSVEIVHFNQITVVAIHKIPR